MLQILLTVIVIPAIAQSRIDTLYYDQYGHCVDYKAFAEYIRVVAHYDDDADRHPFRDFYLSGQLRAEGDYWEIDKANDENSTFNKKYIEYYRSGKVKRQEFWFNGKRDGQCTSYYENGNIKDDAIYDNGLVNGVWLSYSEDGETCKCIEYENGLPKYDYYTLTTKSGLFGKFNSFTNEFIDDYIKPEYNDCIHSDLNDEIWSGYDMNGLLLTLHISSVNQYGKYYKVDIYLKNKSLKNLNFDISNIDVLFVKNNMQKNMKSIIPHIYTSDEYVRKVHNRQSWNMALLSSLGAFNKTSYTTSYTPYGVVQSTTTTTDYNKLQMTSSSMESEANQLEADYVKNQVLAPGDILFGFFLIDRKPSSIELIDLYIDIDGVSYPFQYNVSYNIVMPRLYDYVNE